MTTNYDIEAQIVSHTSDVTEIMAEASVAEASTAIAVMARKAKIKARKQAEATRREIHEMLKGTTNELILFDGVISFEDQKVILDLSSTATIAFNAELQVALNDVFAEIDTPTLETVDPNIKFFNRCKIIRQNAFACHREHCNRIRILYGADDEDDDEDEV